MITPLVLAIALAISPEQWHFAQTENFDLFCSRRQDLEFLAPRIEFQRKWCLDRWGVHLERFSTRCSVYVGQDAQDYQNLFSRSIPAVRVEKSGVGGLTTSFWCWAEPNYHVSILPFLLTEVCLAEWDLARKRTTPLWLRRGMAIANRSVPDIQQNLAELNRVFRDNLPCFWAKDLLEMTPLELDKFEPQIQNWFDRESLALVLYLRQQQESFRSILEGQTSVPAVLRLNAEDMDRFLKDYFRQISSQAATGRMQRSQLTWKLE